MNRLILLLLCIAAPLVASSEPVDVDKKESASIARVFTGMTEAWKAGDGEAWASAFVPDADFTVWFGLQLNGQKAIAEGHQFIFDHFYADTSYELTVDKIRFLSPTVAVVHLHGSVIAPGESAPDEPDSVPLAVVQKISGQWKVAAFQNTPFAVKQYGRNGDLRQFKGRTMSGKQE